MAAVNLRVIDIYHGDRVTSFQKAADFGIWGVIHKATTGATGKDKAYKQRRQPAINAGLLWGAYHWGTDADITKQVDNLLDTAQPDDHTLVALDYEDKRMTLEMAREFLSLTAQRLGRKPVLYSGHLIKDKLGNRRDKFFGSHRLWLAHYAEHPVVQKSWSAYWLWQYTDNKNKFPPNQVPGVPGDANGNLDCNSYEGTRTQLRSEWAS